MVPDDSGAVTAEYAEIFRADQPEKDMAAQVGVVLASLRPDAGPVLDLGAGTGVGTMALADAMPTSRLFAVERSRAMRSILLSRLAFRPQLRTRVTVVPNDIFEAELPDRWGAAVAIHLVCQLSPTERLRLWELLVARLDKGGVALIDQHFGLDGTTAIPQRMAAEMNIGDNSYQRWFESEPISSENALIRNTYRVIRNGAIVDESVSESILWVAQTPVVLAEVAGAGLTVTSIDDRFYALGRS